MSSIILQAHSLTKKYRHTVALDHIDLQIEKGKSTVLSVRTEQVKLLFCDWLQGWLSRPAVL